MRPVICLITDGRLGAGRDPDALVESVGAAARAGVDLIQVRERGVDDRVLAAVRGPLRPRRAGHPGARARERSA